MEIITIIICVIIVILLLESIKHLFFKKTSKIIIFSLIVLILFLVFSYSFKNVDSFQENNFIQTGAVIVDKIFGLVNENVDTDKIINSTMKNNKLFKS